MAKDPRAMTLEYVGGEWVPWPDEEPRWCGGCGVDLAAGEAHWPGCARDEDDDDRFARLVGELERLARDPASVAERDAVDAAAEAELEAAVAP